MSTFKHDTTQFHLHVRDGSSRSQRMQHSQVPVPVFGFLRDGEREEYSQWQENQNRKYAGLVEMKPFSFKMNSDGVRKRNSHPYQKFH